WHHDMQTRVIIVYSHLYRSSLNVFENWVTLRLDFLAYCRCQVSQFIKLGIIKGTAVVQWLPLQHLDFRVEKNAKS
ncbi:unnamed protein product, partial [Heterotrigona itama]